MSFVAFQPTFNFYTFVTVVFANDISFHILMFFLAATNWCLELYTVLDFVYFPSKPLRNLFLSSQTYIVLNAYLSRCLFIFRETNAAFISRFSLQYGYYVQAYEIYKTKFIKFSNVCALFTLVILLLNMTYLSLKLMSDFWEIGGY